MIAPVWQPGSSRTGACFLHVRQSNPILPASRKLRANHELCSPIPGRSKTYKPAYRFFRRGVRWGKEFHHLVPISLVIGPLLWREKNRQPRWTVF
jgi:hypothetical protein